MQEEKRLREGQQHDGINDRKGEHVTCDHAVNHGNEWTSQSNSTGKEHEKEPGGRQSKDQNGFFGVSVAQQSARNAGQRQEIGCQKDGLCRIVGLPTKCGQKEVHKSKVNLLLTSW